MTPRDRDMIAGIEPARTTTGLAAMERGLGRTKTQTAEGPMRGAPRKDVATQGRDSQTES